MSATASREVLSETSWAAEGAGLWTKRAVLVAAGVAALTLAAQTKAPAWPAPGTVSLGAFAVLTLGVAQGRGSAS